LHRRLSEFRLRQRQHINTFSKRLRAYVLSRHTVLQASGIWWSFPVTNAAVAVISVCWFAQGGWKKTRLTEEDRQVIKIAEETIAEDGIR
jgi:hypothetical protein